MFFNVTYAVVLSIMFGLISAPTAYANTDSDLLEPKDPIAVSNVWTSNQASDNDDENEKISFDDHDFVLESEDFDDESDLD